MHVQHRRAHINLLTTIARDCAADRVVMGWVQVRSGKRGGGLKEGGGGEEKMNGGMNE